MILRELQPGDKFVHAKAKGRNPKRFVVNGNCIFNRGHGTSTRMCVDLGTKENVGKSCNLEVRKIGESVHKEKLMEKFSNKAV